MYPPLDYTFDELFQQVSHHICQASNLTSNFGITCDLKSIDACPNPNSQVSYFYGQ
jgi:hypothetical protein